jgi:hypothetical protein
MAESDKSGEEKEKIGKTVLVKSLNYPISFKFNFKMFMKHCCDFSVTFLF